jgi:PPK2 family polyphosphate:nucleotide phosphotransferase
VHELGGRKLPASEKQPLTVPPGKRVRLAELDPGFDAGRKKDEAVAETAEHVAQIVKLSYRLFAEDRRAVLLVLQGMDAAGKDGTIRQVMQGINPQMCQVESFKQPTPEELDHDFLWRVHQRVPGRGTIGIFNRSHYEDVVVVRVKNLVPRAVWEPRYEQINQFEELLAESGTTLVKCFLHISSEEQRQRLQARLDDPEKRWKFRLGDLDDRKLWDAFQEAYSDALTRCNTAHAPWHIVPANKKWYRNLVVSRLLRQTLERLDPRVPAPDPALDGLRVE